MTPANRTSSSTPRRGSVYVLVLALVMLMMVSGAAAVAVSRMRSRTIRQSNDTVQADVLAESAVEQALALLSTNTNWRTTYTSGNATAQKTFGAGTINFKFVDECDNNLSNSAGDPVRIYGYGRAGQATQAYSVQAAGTGALTCLNAAIVVGGDINFSNSLVNGAGMTIAANGNVNGGTAVIHANVEAAGSINSQFGFFTGSKTSGVPKRSMPGCSVFDSYVASGTAIALTSLPFYGASGRKIELCVISPASNPFGAITNPKGVYVIDCQNKQIVIRNCRIVGTLVLLNIGVNSAITATNSDAINWAPAIANYPCLLVDGNLILEIGSSGSLQESSVNVNLNPAGTPYPYPSGTSNASLSDSYPCQINGLVYVSGNVSGNGNGGYSSNIDMLVVGGSCDFDKNTFTPSYSSTLLTSPPPGFTGTGSPIPVAGTWRREPAP